MTDFVDYVNPLQGTDSARTFSSGNTLPLVGRPFAMTSWCLQTSEGRWFFHPRERRLQGIRATRQPSPWIGDYGHFVLMPQVGERLVSTRSRASGYRTERSVIRPHYMKVHLDRYETTMEMTATERCGFMRVVFPTGGQEKRLILDLFPGDSQIQFATNGDSGTITGFTRANSGGVPAGFACYFVVELDCPLSLESSGREQLSAFAELRLDGEAAVEVRIGTSFISIDQAMRNLAQEIGRRDFEHIRRDAGGAWNDLLGRMEIDPVTEDDRKTFYSCLYRSFLFPRKWHEFDENNSPVHYSPYDDRVHPGIFYADNGFWDTHRTVYPLLSIVAPKELTEILNGWVNHYVESGWFPKWSSPGERGVMIGTHIDAVIADAVVKGIRGFDLEKAFEGMMKHALQKAPDGHGRVGIEDYIRLGYVPEDRVLHGASRTMDFAYGDFCIAQVAIALGRKEEAESMLRRAGNYRNVFDPSVGFIRGRNADESWVEPFNEFAWGGPYVEGSVWQCGWAVPHDPAGLIELMGGNQKFVEKLDRMLSLPPRYHVGAYGEEIHEMTEMAAVNFGQYAHSNQPVHHVLYLFAAAGRPDRTQYWVRRVLRELYGPGLDGFSGDEDNGEMASWFVLSSLGVYPLCPGVPTYVFGSPLFHESVLHLPTGKDLTIAATDNSPEHPYVELIRRDGRHVTSTSITHADLTSGGRLQFDMAAPVQTGK
ncbi:MAG: GH92 family glycosyl hydrolase [Rhodothermia bacterium]